MSVQQIDYEVKHKPVGSRYKISKIPVHSTSTGAYVVASATGLEVNFEIPANVFNLSRGSLKFTSTPAAVGPNNFAWMYADVMAPIAGIELYDRAGMFVAKVENADRQSAYSLKEVQASGVDIVDSGSFIAHATTGAVTAQVASTLNETYGCISGDETFTATKAVQSDTTPATGGTFVIQTSVVTGLNRVNNNPRYDGTFVSGSGKTEPQYLKVRGSNATVPIQLIDIPLSLFKDSVFDLDKDLYFGQIMRLKVRFNPAKNWMFLSLSGTDPSATAAPSTTAITLSNVALYMAYEEDPFIIKGLEDKVNSPEGFQTIIPHTYSMKNTIDDAIGHNITINLDRTHGRYLKKVYHLLFDKDGAANETYNHSILTGTANAFIKNYVTRLDGNRRQDFDVTTDAVNEDWLMVKDHLKGTLIAKMDTYRYNWFVLDNYDLDDNGALLDSGVPLNVDRKWNIVLTTDGTQYDYDHYTFAVVNRMLKINSTGFVVE